MLRGGATLSSHVALAKLASTGRWISLSGRTLVGRAPYATLQLADPVISNEHAVLEYDGDWWLRDLGSRNGTTLGEARIAPGERHRLSAGDAVGFGQLDTLEIASVEPPGPIALPAEGSALHGADRLLSLPDEADVALSIHIEGMTWVVDEGDHTRPVADGEVVRLKDRAWTLCLPANISGPGDLTVTNFAALDVAMGFTTSADGEEVLRAEVVVEGQHTPLAVRTHLQLPLVLAEQRMHDRARGVPDIEQGWLDVDVVCRQVPVSQHLLAMYVHRTRRQLADAGVPHAEDVIGSRGRRPHRQLRYGFRQASIDRSE